MKTAIKEVLTALYTSLNGNIVHNTVNIPVYNSVPFNAPNSYIYINQVQAVSNGVKGVEIEDIIVTIDVVTQFDVGGSQLNSLEINNLVASNIESAALSLGNDYKIVLKKGESIEPLSQTTETKQVFRALSKWRFKVEHI